MQKFENLDRLQLQGCSCKQLVRQELNLYTMQSSPDWLENEVGRHSTSLARLRRVRFSFDPVQAWHAHLNTTGFDLTP
jgi:hypothetical protein